MKSKIVFFQRKRRKYGNFSLEFIFEEVRKNLPEQFESVHYTMKYESKGFWRRVYLIFEAFFNQGDVNHITGDIHFIGILLKKKKTVLTILDLGFMNTPSFLTRKIFKFFWIKLPTQNAKVITTISEASKGEILKYTNFKEDQIKVIYVPISKGFKFQPKTFNKDNPVILQIGTASNKNILRLVDAIKGIPCHLEIVGKVSPEINYKLIEYKITHHISWNLTEEEIIKKYLDCDILAFVSTYEGFGMPIIEANSTGRAVITSNILSMPEVGGNAAHYVNPFNVTEIRDGLLKLIKDDQYRDELILNGISNAKRFSIEEIVNQYSLIYNEVLNN